jgi:hypothetical protein
MEPTEVNANRFAPLPGGRISLDGGQGRGISTPGSRGSAPAGLTERNPTARVEVQRSAVVGASSR